MENFHFLHIITVFSLAFVVCHGALTTEDYWKTKLPSSAIPKVVRDLLSRQQYGTAKQTFGSQMVAEVHVHNYDSVPFKNRAEYGTKTAATILAKDMRPGTKLDLEFISTSTSTFLPRQLANSIPFSSSQLPQILNRVSVKPASVEAEDMKLTISSCEKPAVGEEKICATSLESIIDYSTSKLGKNVQAFSTEVKKERKLQSYRITGMKKIGINEELVVCHRLKYPYPVFYCHYAPSVQAYTATLMGEDGIIVKAVTACHVKGKVVPGNVPVCHILPEDNIVWVPY